MMTDFKKFCFGHLRAADWKMKAIATPQAGYAYAHLGLRCTSYSWMEYDRCSCRYDKTLVPLQPHEWACTIMIMTMTPTWYWMVVIFFYLCDLTRVAIGDRVIGILCHRLAICDLCQ
jgi:hypothetical protein